MRTKLSLTTRRVIAGVMLTVSALCTSNYYFGLGLFGSLAKPIMVLSFIAAGLSQIFFGISVEELRAYRAQKQQ